MRFKNDAQRKAMFSKLNPYRIKNFDELKIKGVNLKPFGDTDNDFLPNKLDERPLDKSKPDKKENADTIFDKTKKLTNLEKAEDLSETEEKPLKLTRKNIGEWKKDIKGKDLKGIDTQNISKAEEYIDKEAKTEYKEKHKALAIKFLKDRNIKADLETQREVSKMLAKGEDPSKIDWKTHQSKDKSLKESLFGERKDE